MRYTIEHAVADIKKQIRERGWTPADAVAELWAGIVKRLAPREKDLLSQEGLRGRVSGSMHIDRNQPAQPTITVTVENQPTARGMVSVLVASLYVVGTGETKAILQFTQEDCGFVAQRCREKAHGLLRVAAFMVNLQEVLAAHQVDIVSGLPPETLKELEAKWPG